MTYTKIRKFRKKYSYRRKGVPGRIRVPAHRVTYHIKKRNYAAFKFISPWKQFQEEGEVEPDYAKFGTRKLNVGEERELARLEKELEELRKRKSERDNLIKELETPPKIKFEEPKRKKEPSQESKFIIDLEKKAEKITPEQIVQKHKAEAAEEKKREKQILTETFELKLKERGLKSEDIEKAIPISIQKYDVLLKQDPKGRSLGIDYIENRAVKLTLDELKGKQRIVPGVKTYSDQDYIKEFKKLGYSQRDAENEFFKIPSDVVIGKTPQELIKVVERIPQVKFMEGELIDTSKIIPMSSEEASKILDELLPFRPDLQKHNKTDILHKLRNDIKETGHVPLSTLRDFFNMDKPLKEVLKDEKIEGEAK
ncbi:MAG: hypothetical protein AABY15_04440 [Nanoarchaeota archaeon]